MKTLNVANRVYIILMKWLSICALFVSLNVMAETDESSYVTVIADVSESKVVMFELENISKTVLEIDISNLRRTNMNLVVSYGQGLIVEDEIHWPEDFVEPWVKLGPGEKYQFKIPLKKGFRTLENLSQKYCMFLYWGVTFEVVSLKRSFTFSDSLIINEDFCNQNRDNGSFLVIED